MEATLTKDISTIEITKQVTESASPGAAITFIFSVYSVLSWAQLTGLLGEGCGLMIGIVQVCGAIGFLTGAILNIRRGNPFGAVNLIFAVFFGFIGGVNGIAATYFTAKGIPFDPTVVSIAFFMAGLFVFGILPTMIHLPIYSFLLNFAAGVGLFMLGLAGICGWGNWAYVLAGWMFMVTGTFGTYNAISEVCSDCGVHLPQGRPLVKEKEITTV